jgi:hypothetical protein
VGEQSIDAQCGERGGNGTPRRAGEIPLSIHIATLGHDGLQPDRMATALVIIKPETVIAWHRRGFRLWWAWRSRRRMGRPTVPADVRALIHTMAQANPHWGAPRIQGELLKLGIDVCQGPSRNTWCASASLPRSSPDRD